MGGGAPDNPYYHGKRLTSLRAAVALHFVHCSFVRPHITLKITPAMAAGVTDHFWKLEDLLEWERPYSRN